MYFILYDCGLREKHMQKVFEKGSQGEYFNPIMMRMGSGESFKMANFIVCTICILGLGWLHLEDQYGHGM